MKSKHNYETIQQLEQKLKQELPNTVLYIGRMTPSQSQINYLLPDFRKSNQVFKEYDPVLQRTGEYILVPAHIRIYHGTYELHQQYRVYKKIKENRD